MRVFSVSTSTHFITRFVSLEFCEGYMKVKCYFKQVLKNINMNFKSSVKELNVPKSLFFHCEEYMKVKIMSRVPVGFNRKSWTDGRGRTHGHGFF